MRGNLPQRLPLEQMQVRWASILQPLVDSPTATPTILRNVLLSAGQNTVNHLLGRKLQGWVVMRMRSAFSQIYDVQDTNILPDKTLLLVASADVSVDLLVF